MNSKKTLLLSDGCVSNDVIDPNEILLRFLTLNFLNESFIRAILSRDSLSESQPQFWNGFKYIQLKRIKESWYYLFRFLSFIPDSLTYLFLMFVVIPKQLRQLTDLIKKEKVTQVWIVMTSPQVIFLSHRLLKLPDIEFFSSVWDSPEEYSKMLHMPWLMRQKMLSDFNTIMKRSVNLGVASFNMKKEYETRFNKKCYILQGDVVEDTLIKNDILLPDKYLIIGFAGWLYTPEVWDALFKALDLVKWRLNNKDVKIRIIGNGISFIPPAGCLIEFLGKQPVVKARSILRESYINFVPYRFDEISRYGSSVSFPSKINTYLAAKRPIFTIAPSYSTPFQFIEGFELGVACDSLKPEEIIKSLKKIVSDDTRYQIYIHNAEKIYEECFNPKAFSKTFCEFLNMAN